MGVGVAVGFEERERLEGRRLVRILLLGIRLRLARARVRVKG